MFDSNFSKTLSHWGRIAGPLLFFVRRGKDSLDNFIHAVLARHGQNQGS
jgi:hypothetical protein